MCKVMSYDTSKILSDLSIPIIAALIGWFTNFIAVKMIFRPRRPYRFFGITFHGLIPRRQREIAESIGETVARDLISHKDVEEVLRGIKIHEEIAPIVANQVDNFVQRMPMVAMFLQGSMLDQIKTLLTEEIEKAMPSVLDRVVTGVEQNLDFKTVVRTRIEGFDLSKLEEIIYRISSRELKTIEYLGGVLGFIVGLLQLAIVRI